VLEFEVVTPGQDGDEENDPMKNPDHDVAQIREDRQIGVEVSQGAENKVELDDSNTVAQAHRPGPEGNNGRAYSRSVAGESRRSQRSGYHNGDLEAQ